MNILPFLVFALQTQAQPPTQDTVLAKVNDKPITAADVSPMLWEWYGAAAVQEIVAYRLITEEAAKLKIAADEKEVEDSIRQQVAQLQEGLPPGQDVDAVLKERGMPRSRLRMRVVADQLLNKLAEAEFRPDGFVKVSTIVIKPGSDTEKDKQEALAKARTVRDRLVKGEKWEEVLKSVTDDPNLLRGNGALDWNAIVAFPASTQAELRQLAVGGLTQPVETPYGIQIFRVDAPGKDAKASDLETLKSRAVPRLRQSVFERLRKNSEIVALK